MTTTPTTLRDAGMTATTNVADPRLILTVDRVIADHASIGEPFSANDIRSALPVVAAPLVGARVHAAAMRKPTEIVRVGMTRSDLPSTHHAWIAVWCGVTA